MKVQFLSVSSWKPTRPEDDTVSLLVNDSILVDTGWMSVRNLLRVGKTPESIGLLLFTHMHQDRYISLPAFLFYLLNNDHDASTVTICGPERVEEVVSQSLTLAGRELHYRQCPLPGVRTLAPGDRMEWGGILSETCSSEHPAPGLCYRFTEKETGKSFVYTGDTISTEEIARFASGCGVLIHEQARGVSPEGLNGNPAKHSTAVEAAECAKKAGAGALYLVHAFPETKEDSLRAAREIFPESYRPDNMTVIEI